MSQFAWDPPSVFSVVFALSLGPTAQFLAYRFLPSEVPRKTYWLFIWHAYDALTHFFIEGSYLYHSFFSYTTVWATTSDYPHPASLSAPKPHFLNQPDRRYGALYGSGPMARLWREYAKADRRWEESDATVVSLEILTVGLAGPAALYVCYLLVKLARDATPDASKATLTLKPADKARLSALLHFVMTMIATGELYGGFMTFAPEWLTGSTALDTSNPIYLWLYLFFFNVLWVFVPLWVLWGVYTDMVASYTKVASMEKVGDKKKQ